MKEPSAGYGAAAPDSSGLTFEKVWQMFQETDKKFQETDKKFQETDKKLNKLDYIFTSSWGKLIESLVEGDLIRLLNERGIKVQRTFTNAKFQTPQQQGEIDIIAENGNEVVAVEVKTSLKPEDIEEFAATLTIFKSVFPLYKNHKLYGAIAYLKADSHITKRAERLGLFVIRATGKSASITNHNTFKPKEY